MFSKTISIEFNLAVVLFAALLASIPIQGDAIGRDRCGICTWEANDMYSRATAQFSLCKAGVASVFVGGGVKTCTRVGVFGPWAVLACAAAAAGGLTYGTLKCKSLFDQTRGQIKRWENKCQVLCRIQGVTFFPGENPLDRRLRITIRF